MKKIVNISFIFCFLFSWNIANSITCLENGGITYDHTFEEQVKSINIKAKIEGNDTYFDVPGHWKYDSEHYVQGKIYRIGHFTSDELLFNESGKYMIKINAREDINEYSVNCPGLQFSCKLFSTEIYRCDVYNNTYYALFETKNLGKYERTFNPKTDLTYIISDRVISSEIDIITNKLEAQTIGDNRYLLKFITGKNVEQFHIKMPICKSFYSFIKCGLPQKCTSDSECFDFEYCDNECKRLNCSENERVFDHKCASCFYDGECDDSLVCTEDKCKDNKCFHEPVVCKAKDRCSTSICKEPKGCSDEVDLECKKRMLEEELDELSPTIDVPKLKNNEIAYMVQLASKEDIQTKIDENPKMKEEIEKVIGKELTPEITKKIAANAVELSKNVNISRNILHDANKSIMTLKVRYMGAGKVTNFVIYDIVPKSFSSNSKDITVNAPGAIIKIIKEDPEYAFLYPTMQFLKCQFFHH